MISKDKQIEKMGLTDVDILANDINQHCPDLAENYCGDTHCVACLANALTAKGYRKSADVAEEIFAEIGKSIADLEYRANTPRKTVRVEELKAQVNWVLHEVVPKTLAKLKQKYIGKGTNVTTNTEEGK